jgi:hypothetical protein
MSSEKNDNNQCTVTSFVTKGIDPQSNHGNYIISPEGKSSTKNDAILNTGDENQTVQVELVDRKFNYTEKHSNAPESKIPSEDNTVAHIETNQNLHTHLKDDSFFKGVDKNQHAGKLINFSS